MSENAIADTIRGDDLADEALDRADGGKACGNYSGMSTPTNNSKAERP
ncbi:MAG: hypothetical protein HOH66_16955 [Rhodospirillaceae bacterium]|jgi:hypothetical protein|nr:hypothetical protein [Rhodospirillaceae bacterium]